MNWKKRKLEKQIQEQTMMSESIKFIPNRSLEIHAVEAVRTELTPVKVILKPKLISVFKNKKWIDTEIQLPIVIKINFTKRADNYTISIYYFNEKITTFDWFDIAKIPNLTDAIKSLFDLEFQAVKQIYAKEESLIFHSKVKKRTHQVFKFRDNKIQFHLDFQDQIRTKITFDWLLYRLQLENLKLAQKVEISFSDIEKINFILKRYPGYSTFDSLEVTIEGKTFGVKQLVNVETVFNGQYQPKSVFKINPNLTFNSIQNIFNLLKSRKELVEIEIEFLVV